MILKWEDFKLTQKENDVISSLAVLKSKLSTRSTLEVIHEGGYCWEAHFTFNNPVTEENLETLRKDLSLSLPPNYERFLRQSDGALLYYDDNYGQWGFRLYGTKELFAANKRWKDVYKEDWPSTYIAFAESLGDADKLVFDVAQPALEGTDYVVIDGDSGYLPSKWTTTAAPSFGDWLDRLVVAQGAKYWRWC